MSAPEQDRRKRIRDDAQRESELVTLDYHGKDVKRRVLGECRAAERQRFASALAQAIEKLRKPHCALCNVNRPEHAGGPAECDCSAELPNATLDALAATMQEAK